MNEYNFKLKVMFGVYTLYIIRKMKSPLVGELFTLTISAVMLSFLVSLPHVMTNVLANHASYAFVTTAFFKAQMTVKLITIAALAALILFVRNISMTTSGLIRNRFA